ncbi:MAG: carboxypeptidase-like regulatory domain-containing protein [Chitinophagaceae bacterium]|nr:carboxypeptidase-like regulatory domain-containing protein [Chitinophagaceae bacterium]
MQSIKLSIPTPCHENWDNMTPTEQGRFCSVCAKQVVDFTKMSDYEVINYFNKVQGEKVCGRTLSNQLERELEAPKPIVQSKLWYWKYAAAGIMFFTKINDIEAQNVTPLTPVQLNTLNKDTLKGRLGLVAVENKKIITGKILDTDGNVVPFVSVKIMGTKYGTSANANGIYSIKVNSNTDILEFSAVGYKVNHLVLKENVKFDIILENSYSRLQGEVVIVTGGVSVNYNDNEYVAKTQQKHIAMLKIEDKLTKKNITKASITILKDNTEKTINVDKRGIYKLKEIKNEESVVIKISAYGYENKELVIKGENFNNRKEVLK